MGRICIGIYDRECGYARRLAGYIRRRCEDSLEVRVFTSEQTLKECLEGGGLDCLLAGETVRDLWTGCENLLAVRLSEEGKENLDKKAACIEKYQSAEQIWRKLLRVGGEELFGAGFLSSVQPEEETVFIGICSPLHGCGKTRLGLSMSRLLAEYGKTLFVTLDEFSCLPAILGEETPEADLSEIYYYYSQGSLSQTRLQMALCRWGKAEYLAPARLPEDLYPEGKPYGEEFIRCLAGTAGCRYLVLDLGNSVRGKESSLFSMCRKLYVPDREMPGEALRTKAFLQWLEETGLPGGRVERFVMEKSETGWYETADGGYSGQLGAVAERLLRRGGLMEGKEKE